jgi:hypothetical protein
MDFSTSFRFFGRLFTAPNHTSPVFDVAPARPVAPGSDVREHRRHAYASWSRRAFARAKGRGKGGTVVQTSGTSRKFTLEEAKALLPVVRERTRRALEAIGALEAPDEDDETPSEERSDYEARAHEIMLEWARDIERLGIEVKGPWLIDFDSGGGYYCWKWPETSLEYFHGYDEGFSSRVRLQ